MILAVDIGGTNTKYAIFDNERIVLRGVWKTISDKVLIIDKIASIFPKNCDALCISTGGFWTGGKCIGYETLESTADGAFVMELKELLNCKVYIDNDAHCALYAEINQGALKGYNNGAVILLGSSLGCALMINNKPYVGSTGQAGQLFFMPEYYDGKKYTYDEYANTLKLTEEYGGAATKGNMLQMIKNCIKGDIVASNYVRRYINTIALKCWYLYLMYDISVIAIGGCVSKSEYIFDGIVEQVKKFFLMDKTARCPNIVKTILGDDCILTGAMLLSKE